ncbi:MAG TPA: hypothetical protein VJ577_10365 [Burkholderiaceae bacterium]|nr:hypothetical protein [Burkholderiaceae bacterium]
MSMTMCDCSGRFLVPALVGKHGYIDVRNRSTWKQDRRRLFAEERFGTGNSSRQINAAFADDR